MLKFKIPNRFPPGGRFFYTIPETGMYLDSRTSRGDLLSRIQGHYRANNIAIPVNLEAIVDDHICRNVDPGFCEGDDEGRTRSLAWRLGFWQIVERTQKSVRGRPLIDRDVAETRANVCLNCKHNMRNLCTTCNGLGHMFQASTGGRSTRVDEYLGVCELTAVALAAAVFLAHPALETEGAAKPEGCWVLEVTDGNGREGTIGQRNS